MGPCLLGVPGPRAFLGAGAFWSLSPLQTSEPKCLLASWLPVELPKTGQKVGRKEIKYEICSALPLMAIEGRAWQSTLGLLDVVALRGQSQV